MFVFLSLALAEDAQPAAASASQPPAPQPVIVEVFADPAVARARAQLYQSLKDLGYRKGDHKGDETIFRSYTPYQPRVIVHDDGWVTLKREPPRVHIPGKTFADQGAPANYLWCIIAPTACVSVGGWTVGPRKLQGMKGDVLDAVHEDVNRLNEAVARRYLQNRVNTDIPVDCERIWAEPLPAEARRRLLFTYWDSRLDTPEGDIARGAIMAFIRGVVTQSDVPYSLDEIVYYNSIRSATMRFDPTIPTEGQ